MKRRDGFTIIDGMILAAAVAIVFAITWPLIFSGDDDPVAATGVKKATANVTVDADGLTVEQKNIRDRLEEDNKPGAIKHLYVISAYSGQTLIYSTVQGKVTSGGKRLTPMTTMGDTDGTWPKDSAMSVDINGTSRWTTEIIQDDGTYGNSMNYLFWFDSKGIYHQHYVSGGQIVHISAEPLAVKSVVINMELSGQ